MIREKDRMVQAIPEMLKDGSVLLSTKHAEWMEKQKNSKARHKHHVQTLKDAQEREVDFIGKQYQYWIDKRDTEMQQFTKDFLEYHE